MTPETAASPKQAPLVILAAGGGLPVEVAREARAAGRDVFIIGLEGDVDAGINDFPHAICKWGQLGRVEELARTNGAGDLIMVGAVSRRPDFTQMALDLGTIRALPKLVKAMVGGDDSVLASMARHIEDRGFRLVGVSDVAPGLVAAEGTVAGRAPTGELMEDARLAFEAVRAIGAIDAGQSAVVVRSRVVALEAAEGTDAMLRRVGEVRAAGRAKWSGKTGVMAKCAKPQQDLRLDMPVIGPRTVEAVAEAGLAGIALEAGRVVIAHRSETIGLARDKGIFIHAFGPGAQP